MPDADDVDEDTYDQYVGANGILPNNSLSATVKGRKQELDVSVHGKANANPKLDTSTYAVEFDNGSEAEYLANVIAESMYDQCDTEGNQTLLLDAISYYKTNQQAVQPGDTC